MCIYIQFYTRTGQMWPLFDHITCMVSLTVRKQCEITAGHIG